MGQKSVMHRLRFKRVRSRFLAMMILLTVPSIMLLGLFSMNITNGALIHVNEQANSDQLRTSSEVANMLFRNINQLHRSLVLNQEIRSEMRENSRNPGVLPDIENLRTSTRLQRLIGGSSADVRFVTSICLMDLQFRAYCSGRSDNMGAYEGEDKMQRIQASQWYRNAYKNKGKIEFLPSDLFGESEKAFSTIRLFRDADNIIGEPIGILIVNVSKAIFGNIFNTNGAGKSGFGTYMALARQGDKTMAVYSNAGDLPLGSGMTEEVLERLGNQGYVINSFDNQTSGWTFVHLVHKKELLKESQRIRWVTTVFAVAFSLMALVISYFFSGTITRPLLQVKKMMLDWTKGVRTFPNGFAQDEVGVIGETFKRLASEYDELHAKLVLSELKEREAELRVLQSQIKPHFLYNTLDSIYWLAVMQNNHKVAEMAVSLSESFKLSLNNGKELIFIHEELKHIEHYLNIQNIRFNNRFRYIEDVEEAVLGSEILKLLLQPLVENAIYHGLEPKLGEGVIRLTGRREGERLVFAIEDDGVGMEDINRIGQGYGLRNVRERLELYYGPDSSLDVWSEPGAGTRITLRFHSGLPKENRHQPKE